MAVSFFIGRRYAQARTKRGFVSFITFFSITGVLLGVAALILVVSVMNGFEQQLKQNILGIVPQVIISPKQNADFRQWQKLRTQLLKLDQVKAVTPQAEAEALVQSPNALEGVLLQGVQVKYEQQNFIAQHIQAGDFNALANKPYQLVLGRALAQKLQVSLYDKVRIILPNSSHYTPMGRVPSQRLFTVAGIFESNSAVDASMVYLSAKSLARLNRQRDDGIKQLRLYLSDAFLAEKVQQQLQHDAQFSQYQVTTWQQSQGAFFDAVKMEKRMMWLMLSLIVAVAAFNIVSALVMVVVEKQGEIAIVKTLGLDNQGIIKIFITQGMINGVFGAAIGAIIGVGLTFNINQVLSILGINLFGAGIAQQLPTLFRWQDLLIICSSAIVMTFLATLYPAYRAAQTQPAEVLRNE